MTLRRLLELVEDGRPRTVGELSGELGVDRQLVCAMLDHLAAIGRIEKADWLSAGPITCSGCPVAGRCAVSRPVAGSGSSPRVPPAGRGTG
jgi:predicted ArsR family transcriptional regulator